MRIGNFKEQLATLEKQFEQLEPKLQISVYDQLHQVTGHVVVWNTITDNSSPLGLIAKGGTRIKPNLTIEEVKMLAKTMALKNAAAGLPMGGAKSGLAADPDQANFETIYRRFVSSVKFSLKENGGIFGGFGFDIGARPEHPIWACDELQSVKSFTGKPVEMGGTDYDKEGIAGLGVAHAAKVLIENEKLDLANITFSVQGLGAMGAAVLRYFSELGATPRYLAGLRIPGTIQLPQNYSKDLIPAIINQDFKLVNEIIVKDNYAITDINNIIASDVDLFFPCAIQDVIREENYQLLQAKYIVEGANNPISYELREQLHQEGLKIIPDFIANPGGIIAAYVELSSEITPEENNRTRKNVIDAKELTISKVSENTQKIIDISEANQVSPQQAGRFLALKTIIENTQ